MKALFALLLCLTLPLAHATTTIMDLLSKETRFSSIIQALQRTALIPYINNYTANGLTLFAPLNEAFTDPAKVQVERIKFHILPFNISSTAMKNGSLLETALVKDAYLGEGQLGQRLKVNRGDKDIFVGGLKLLETDLWADNGVIHVIDGLLDPPVKIVETARNIPGLSRFADAVSSSGFIDTLNSAHPFTVFAPVDSAIEAVDDLTREYLLSVYASEDMRIVLKFHTHPGTLYIDEMNSGSLEVPVMVDGSHEMVRKDGIVTLDGHPIQDMDIIASNGVIHSLSRLLIPPSFHMNGRKLLIGMHFTRFVDLFDNSGIAFHLSNHSMQNPITIFAFSNDVFDESPWKQDDEPRTVRQMLEYHVLEGTYGVDDFRDNDVLPTALSSAGMNGRSQVVTVNVTEREGAKEIWINGARIIGESTYVETQGVTIHTISHVLAPPESPIQLIIADLNFSTFVTTLITSHLENTVRDARSVTLFVPTNAAFARLGAVMSYLVLPETLPKLQSLVKHHIADSVIYAKDLPGADRDRVETTFPTLDGTSNITVRVVPFPPHLIIGDDQTTHPSQFTSDPPRNHPSTTGNIFTITQVLLPPTLHIELNHLLEGLHARTITRLIKHASIPVLDTPPENPYTLLVPSETSFKHIDVDELVSNPNLLLSTVRAHIVKGRAELADGTKWETLNDGMWVLVSSLGQDAWELEIVDAKGAPVVFGTTGRARVLQRGEAVNGNVFEVDRVFLIQPTSKFPWIGIVISVLSVALLAGIGGGAWWYVRRRRSTSGYEAVVEEEAAE